MIWVEHILLYIMQMVRTQVLTTYKVFTDWNKLTARVTQVMLKQCHFYFWKLGQTWYSWKENPITTRIRPQAKPWFDLALWNKIWLRHRARNKALKHNWHFRLTKSSSDNYLIQQTHGPHRSPKGQFKSKLLLYQNVDQEKKSSPFWYFNSPH